LLKVAKAVIAVTTWQVVAFYVFLPPSAGSCDKPEGVIPDGNPPGKPPGESGGVESGPPSGPNIFEGPAAPSVDQPIDVSREDEPPPSQAPAEDTGEFCLPFDADEYAALFNDVFFKEGRPEQHALFASWSALRWATWRTAAFVGIPPPGQHPRYAQRRAKAVGLIDASDVTCLQETHGDEYDAAAFAQRVQGYQVFASSCVNRTAGGVLTAVSRNVVAKAKFIHWHVFHPWSSSGSGTRL